MDIEGIGGIFPGNVFQSAYIPKSYLDQTVFQLMEVNHEVSSTGWTVSLKGIMRMSYIKRYGKEYEEMMKVFRDLEKIRIPKFPYDGSILLKKGFKEGSMFLFSRNFLNDLFNPLIINKPIIKTARPPSNFGP